MARGSDAASGELVEAAFGDEVAVCGEMVLGSRDGWDAGYAAWARTLLGVG